MSAFPESGRSYTPKIAKRKGRFRPEADVAASGTQNPVAMYCLEDTDIVVILIVNVGQTHNGLTKSPIGMFFRDVWLPTVVTYLGR